MPTERFLLVTDTPGIKQFVFGTDALAEVRGASALLDRLNRVQTERLLRERLPQDASCETVFANGGTGQFILDAPDIRAVEEAVEALACHYREETGGDARIVWGLVTWPHEMDYADAVREAYFRLRTVRETTSDGFTAPQLPLFRECSSASHLPPRLKPFRWGGESLLLSESVCRKRIESRHASDTGPWAGWMSHLTRKGADTWPRRDVWPDLRVRDAADLNRARLLDPPPARKGYVGLVYADGNAMGRLVQELDSPPTCRAFSKLVDGNIRRACHEALDTLFGPQIAAVRQAPDQPRPLPADILLLGGDDLLVLLPADVALTFGLLVTEKFEQFTREEIASLPSGEKPRQFFDARLKGRGLTVSCGVALAPAKYPFYLLLDLAEDLLKSAKQGGSRDKEKADYWAPSYIDFHLIVGPASVEIDLVREEDYHGKTDYPRTLRPYSRQQLLKLRDAVTRLRLARLPRSKLQDLFDAALIPAPKKAQDADPDRFPTRATLRARELFGRLRQDRTHTEQQALWLSLLDLGALTDFPWLRWESEDEKTRKKKVIHPTALADLVEAYDLFPPPEEP